MMILLFATFVQWCTSSNDELKATVTLYVEGLLPKKGKALQSFTFPVMSMHAKVAADHFAKVHGSIKGLIKRLEDDAPDLVQVKVLASSWSASQTTASTETRPMSHACKVVQFFVW